jgi:hypothetical protein
LLLFAAYAQIPAISKTPVAILAMIIVFEAPRLGLIMMVNKNYFYTVILPQNGYLRTQKKIVGIY